MRNIIACAAVCLVMAGVPANGFGQQIAPSGEIFGGYSFVQANGNTGFNANGWEASLTGNFNRSFGLEADLSNHYSSPIMPPIPAGSGSTAGPHTNGFSYLFGPHFTFRVAPRVSPFIHFLVGGTRGTSDTEQVTVCAAPVNSNTVCPEQVTECPANNNVICPTCPPCDLAKLTQGSQRETTFTTAFGGGLDVKAARFVWIRIIQADYLRQPFTNDTQNNLRLSFGVVFRFGS
ncbi:MAG TPA: outer membrane beta-barrel protein [Terriglobia bacterium]|nr:outer membrane beta-barrel protein [Terriglobia bacterium]